MSPRTARRLDCRISDVLYIINRVKSLDGRFQINQYQCKRLVGFYKRAGVFFDQIQEYVNDDPGYERLYSLPAMDVIKSVLQKGQVLVEKYTEKDWFESMMTAGVNQDSFKAIHMELEACILPLHEDVKEELRFAVLTNLETVVPLLFLDEDDRTTLFDADADKDKKFMLEMIESMRITSINARNTNLTANQVFEIRSLDMAREKISGVHYQQSATETQVLPSYLRIESSEIEVLKLIGSGGSADVHKCRWLHREYAVKIFKADDVVGLRKEVENLIPLRHPNIVLLVGFSIRESDVCPMVVMELLDCDLHTLIHTGDVKVASMRRRWRRRRETNLNQQVDLFPIGVAIDFIYQIATGMTYLHKKKVLHGDLKALNVLVKRYEAAYDEPNMRRYELKIADFGVSDKLVLKENHVGHESDCTSFSTANVGTRRWQAPEVSNVAGGDLKPYSMKADVYSFAMTCVEILTRDVPFHYLPTKEIREHVKAGGRPELPSNVPEDLHKLIVRCWDSDPKLRPDFSEICTDMQGLNSHSVPPRLHTETMGDPTRVPGFLSKVFRYFRRSSLINV